MSIECGHCGNKVHDINCPNNNAVASSTKRTKRVKSATTSSLTQEELFSALKLIYNKMLEGSPGDADTLVVDTLTRAGILFDEETGQIIE